MIVILYTTQFILLKVQTRREYNFRDIRLNPNNKESARTVAFDLYLAFFHFLEKFWISNNTRSISHFATGLVKTCNYPYNCSLCNIGQCSDLFKRLRKGLQLKDNLKVWFSPFLLPIHKPPQRDRIWDRTETPRLLPCKSLECAQLCH